MWRKIGSVVAGLAAWVVIATILDRALRLVWPEYAAALPVFQFTLPMMLARLTEGALTTIAAGWFARWIARTPLWLAYVQGSARALPGLRAARAAKPHPSRPRGADHAAALFS